MIAAPHHRREVNLCRYENQNDNKIATNSIATPAALARLCLLKRTKLPQNFRSALTLQYFNIWCTRFDTGKKEEGDEMVVATGGDGWYVPCQKVHGFPITLREPRDLDEAKGYSIHGEFVNTEPKFLSDLKTSPRS